MVTPADTSLSQTAGRECRTERHRMATFISCPHCDGEMRPEHAHYRCARCGWRDSCCD